MARALWTGSLNFGLVTIPVQLVTAVRDRDIHFHLLDEDAHCRLRRKLVCPDDNREVPYDKTVLGYEVSPDEYVIVDKKELNQLKPESGRAIQITDFVNLSEVDPQYFDRPYHLVPDEGGKHAYSLLLAAMKESGRAGIASFVMRQKQYLALIRPLGNRLGLVTMRYADEISKEAEAVKPEPARSLPKRELQMALQLVDSMSGEFEPGKYHDEYQEQVRSLLEQKSKGKKPRIASAAPRGPKVINLMDALKASLAENGRPEKRARTRARNGRRRKVS